MTGLTRVLVGWAVALGALGLAVALRGDLELALTVWACAVAIPAVVWWYEVRGNGKEKR